MKPFLQIRLLILGVLFAGAIFGSTAFANVDLVSAADSQHFEQTYEDWAKSVIKNLNPKLDFTVLSRVEFSRNPERIQDYEDIKAASHLPGLPDMSDPNYTNPLDSPIYALVAKKNFKIIFYSHLSEQEISLAREVLTSKLRLGSEDVLNFEYLNRSAPEAPKAAPKMRVTESTLFTFIAGIALLMGAFFSLRNKNVMTIQKAAARFSAEAEVAVPAAAKAPVEVKIAPMGASAKSSEAPNATAKPIVKAIRFAKPVMTPPQAALHQIQTASSAVLKKVLMHEKAELIARASLNANKAVSNRILGECERDRFDLATQWISSNHKSVSVEESNYARLLLSARIQQVQNERVLGSIDAFNKAREMKMKLKNAQPKFSAPVRNEVNEAIL